MTGNFGLLRDCVMMRNWRTLKEELAHMQEVDIAFFIESLPSDQALTVFRMLDKDIAAEVFSNLPSEKMMQLIGGISDEELKSIMSDLMVDDAVDMLEEMPANVVRRVLSHTSVHDRQLINQFLRYPENSAGSIMTAEYIRLKKGMSVAEAISHIRKTGDDSETVYTCYVTDDKSGRLEGVITVKTLLLSSDECIVGDLMEKDVISVKTSDDQEYAASVITRYDLLALPVTDNENRLVGIITVDDVMDVMVEENTEDIEKMSALTPSDKPYLKTGVFTLAKNRIVWLIVLMVLGMLTGLILSSYERAFMMLPILVTFIPMLTDTGGNAGSQSSALVIRGMAIGEIEPKDFLTVLWKELRVALIVGFVLSLLNFVRLILIEKSMMLALAVSLALYLTMIVSKAIGGLLPIAAKKCHLDPAMMASPLITTIVDAFSLMIYFSIAVKMLGL